MCGPQHGKGPHATPIHSATVADRDSTASNYDGDIELDILLFHVDPKQFNALPMANEIVSRTTGDVINPVKYTGDGGSEGIPARPRRGTPASSVDNATIVCGNCVPKSTRNNGTQDGAQWRMSQRTQVPLEQNDRQRVSPRGQRSTMEGKWKKISTTCSDVTLEADFIDEIIDSSAGMYAEVVVARLKVEVAYAGLPDGRIEMVVMKMKPFAGTLLQSLNQTRR